MVFACTIHCIQSKIIDCVYRCLLVDFNSNEIFMNICRAIAPRLTIYVSLDGTSFHAIYLYANTTKELMQKMFNMPGFIDYMNNGNANNENNLFSGWSKYQTHLHIPTHTHLQCHSRQSVFICVLSGYCSKHDIHFLKYVLNMLCVFAKTLFLYRPFSLFVDLQSKYSGSGSNIYDATKLNIYINGPAGINVFVTNEVLNNIKDDSLFSLDIQNNKVLMKAVYKNEIN